MTVSISLFLFGKPAQELDREGEAISAAEVRGLADHLHGRLSAVADTLEKLEAGGWEPQMTLYDVSLCHPCIDTEDQARTWLQEHDLDPEEFLIMEFEDEADYEDEPEEGYEDEFGDDLATGNE